jgi:uncharacterized membrane protein YgdD (TMEM256/DUF423 family)
LIARSARSLWIAGAALGLTGVALGAFGTHALRGQIPLALLGVFETAVRYQMLHAPVVLVAALAHARSQGRSWLLAGWMWVGGIVVFSGSLYLMVATGWRMLGAVTPLGGAALIGGWCAAGYAGWAHLAVDGERNSR